MLQYVSSWRYVMLKSNVDRHLCATKSDLFGILRSAMFLLMQFKIKVYAKN